MNAISIITGFRIEARDNLESQSSGSSLKELLSGEVLPVLFIFFVYGTLITTAIGGVNLVVPLYLETKFALSASKIALFFTLQSFITLLTQMPSGKLADRYGRKKNYTYSDIFYSSIICILALYKELEGHAFAQLSSLRFMEHDLACNSLTTIQLSPRKTSRTSIWC